MSDFWWVAPILSLIGALLGGMLASWVGSLLAERRADRALVREARIALERWHATRVGPMALGYPGIGQDIMKPISEDSIRQFFNRHLENTFEAKAALGAVRSLDGAFAEVLDLERWDLPAEEIEGLRIALLRAEKRAWKGKRDERVNGEING